MHRDDVIKQSTEIGEKILQLLIEEGQKRDVPFPLVVMGALGAAHYILKKGAEITGERKLAENALSQIYEVYQWLARGAEDATPKRTEI